MQITTEQAERTLWFFFKSSLRSKVFTSVLVYTSFQYYYNTGLSSVS